MRGGIDSAAKSVRAPGPGLVVWAFLGSALLGGCGDRVSAEEFNGPDRFVIEVGGGVRPLRARLGLPPIRRGDPTDGEQSRRSRVVPTPQPTPVLPPQPDPTPPRAVTFEELRSGETLSGLCRRMLGSANRWREVAELNGWSEADTRRLQVGTKVRLPAN